MADQTTLLTQFLNLLSAAPATAPGLFGADGSGVPTFFGAGTTLPSLFAGRALQVSALTLGGYAVPGTAGLTFATGTLLNDTALGTVALTSTSATNQFRVVNGSNLEYGALAWASNFLNVGTVTNGGTARTVRLISASTQVIVAPNGSDAFIFTATGPSKYAGITAVGLGNPVIVANGRATAQAAANASISTFTVGAADGSFEVSANLNATVVTTLATTLTCTYTDESNTARTMILPIQQLSGSFIAAGAITGVGAWETPVMHIRAKAATAITILTSAGTFTGVTYTAEGIIKQTA